MAKGNNNVKSKRSHYKPYDSANSSLVSRLTTRVSEILPQPSWLSRWLTPAEENEIRGLGEDGTNQQAPPTKRMRMVASNDIGSPHHNHIRNRIGNDPEISPILRSRSDQPDGVVAGPSGLHLRGANFVASTPAVQVPTVEPPVKVNGDEGSDGSESTSGCSSLVPQGERTSTAPFPESTSKPPPVESPMLSITPHSLGGRRLSIKPRNRAMDLSTSLSRSRPSFDTYAFSNPLNESSASLNTSMNRTLNDSAGSPFYRGRTMYGGNSSCKESLSLSVMSPRVGSPRVVSVKPTSTPVRDRDTISTSALRILKALEQYSTPVSEMKKVPVRNDSERRKRKAPPQPFEDLVIPSMPDLLRIKRKERSSESSTSTVPVTTAPVTTAPSTPKPYQLPPPVQPLSVRDDVPEPKRVMRGKNLEEMTSERVEKVNLPSIPLPITSLPSFSLPSLPKSEPSASKTTPPTLSYPATTPAPAVVANKTEKLVNQTKMYSFAHPRVESDNESVQQIKSIKPAMKFREPMDAEKVWTVEQNEVLKKDKLCEKPETSSSLKTSSAPVMMNLKTTPSTFQPKLKNAKEKPPQTEKGFLKTSVDNNAGSVVDFLRKEKPRPKEDTLKPLSELFKKPSGSWTCQECLVPNSADKDKCSACECPKVNKNETQLEKSWVCSKCSKKNKDNEQVCPCGLRKGEKPVQNSWGDFKVPSDTWECSTCLVRNKSADSSCAACSTAKPGAKKDEPKKPETSSVFKKPETSLVFKKPEGNWECTTCLVSNKSSATSCVACTTPKCGERKSDAKTNDAPPSANSWGNLFKKPEGNWDCAECLVSNNATATSCVACSTKKPGSSSGSTTSSGFSFGIPPSTKESNAPSKSTGFVFGIPQGQKDDKSSSFTGFTFGVPKTTDKDDENKSATPNVARKPEPDVIEIADDEGCPPKKRVSFGEPLASDKPASETPKPNVFSFAAKSDAKPVSVGALPSKPAVFPTTSDAASSSTDAKITDFGAGAVSLNVSSSTDKSDKPDAQPFSFGAPAASKPGLFATEKKPDVGFAPPSNPFPSSTGDKPFMFGTVNNADTSKVDGSALFGQKESKSFFGMPVPSETKPPAFFNSENKTGMFNTVADKNIFGGSVKPSFGGTNTVFPATANSTGFNSTLASTTAFGSQTAPMNNADKPMGFGAAPSGTPFGFGGADAGKPGGFAFPTPTPMNASPFGGFNSEPPKFGAPQPNATPNAQPATIFGAPAASPMFNNPNPTPAFSFGSSQPETQPQPQPTFGFGTAQPQAAATPFLFNAISSPAPSQPPTFDPNVKPSFNFTGGAATPTFAAPPSTSNELKHPADRKIRRAVRRSVPK